MTGRGAWPADGRGGTRKYKDGSQPGPYYFFNTGKKPASGVRNGDEYAVWRAVIAYQAALNRLMKVHLTLDGVFGPVTSGVVYSFQESHSDQTGTPWGGIGPDTSEALLKPLLHSRVAAAADPKITDKLVSGTVRHESLWDAGAVGFVDPSDYGLAQINGNSHPDLSVDARLDPAVAFDFVVSYYQRALAALGGNLRDSVASYNLGLSGAKAWIKAGRPDMWTPAGADRPRNVKGYIDSILKG